nr:MAG TPA: hypothetical protein [Caudoviricetes sp.]
MSLCPFDSLKTSSLSVSYPLGWLTVFEGERKGSKRMKRKNVNIISSR